MKSETETEKVKNKKKLNAVKSFDTIIKFFENVGIYQNQGFEDHSINCKSVVILMIIALNIIFTAIFLLFKAKTIGEYSDSFYYTVTLMAVFLIIVEFIRKTVKINEMIKKFENSIQKGLENPSSKLMYEKMNKKIEKRNKMLYFCLINLTLSGALMPNLIVSYFIYFTTDSSSDAFRLAFPMWLPFEWRTPFGYLFAFAIQFAGSYCIVFLTGCYLSFLIGSCETLLTLSEDVKNDLHAMDESNKTDGNPVEFKRKMCEFIDRLSDARQFARDFSEIYEMIITGCFLWSLSSISITLLIVQMELNSGHLIDIIRPLTIIFWAFFAILLVCNSGEEVSTQLDAITDDIYECDWYTFPIELQKMSLTIMTATQKPVYFRGFGNILLTRGTFKTVANGGYSYFTVLRRFNN